MKTGGTGLNHGFCLTQMHHCTCYFWLRVKIRDFNSGSDCRLSSLDARLARLLQKNALCHMSPMLHPTAQCTIQFFVFSCRSCFNMP